MRFFGEKIRQFLNLEKAENMKTKSILKKNFHRFTRYLQQNGKKVALVAGRLVTLKLNYVIISSHEANCFYIFGIL